MSHYHHHHINLKSIDNIKKALIINFSLTVLEFIVGLYSNSMAIISNGIHDLGDSLSLSFSIFFEKLGNKDKNSKFTYGYRRLSLLSALINGIILTIGLIIVIYKSIIKIFSPEELKYTIVAGFAIIGILANFFGTFILSRGSTLNEKMLSWHFIEDIFGWIAIFIMGVINHYYYLPILDPLLSLIFSVILLKNVYKVLKEIFTVFLQAVPSTIDYEKLKNEILKLDDSVEKIEDFHIWSMDGHYNVATLKIKLKNEVDSKQKIDELKEKIRKLLIDNKIKEINIEVG